jgi:hypothetical protein
MGRFVLAVKRFVGSSPIASTRNPRSEHSGLGFVAPIEDERRLPEQNE